MCLKKKKKFIHNYKLKILKIKPLEHNFTNECQNWKFEIQ